MELQTFQYNMKKGWSVDTLPDMDSAQTLVLIFAAPEFLKQSEPIKELAKQYPTSTVVGCSTSGEIYDNRILDLSLSVAVMKFKDTKIKAVKTDLKSANESFIAGKSLAEKLNSRDLASIFVLSDGLHVNGTDLVKGLNAVVSSDVKVTGGLAGDGKRFETTWTIYNGNLEENAVVAVGLYGSKVKIGHASKGGWDIFGPERLVTRSTGNVLYELDGRPALELYKEYLGERAKELPASGLLYPLAIRADQKDNAPLVRTILSVDEKAQSLTFAGDIPQGNYAQLMRANFDRLISSAGETGDIATNLMFNGKQNSSIPILCLAISCVGRRLLLGERTEEELESLAETLPDNTKKVGFYSYGELSPYGAGSCQLHNQTMTITTICEE
jgi:hypothetical protein